MIPSIQFKSPQLSPIHLLLLFLNLFSSLTSTATVKFNPGLVAKFPKASLYPVTKLALPVINPLISHLEIDRRFEMGIITLKGFDLDVSPLTPPQFKFNFDDVNSISSSVEKLEFKFKSPVDIAIWVFKSKGWIRASGKVSQIKWRTSSHPFTDKYTNKPFVSLNFDVIDLKAGDIEILADIDWVPDWIMSQLISFIKSNVVEAVRLAILDWLNTMFTPTINDKIKEEYPETLKIDGTDFALQTAFTDPIFFDQNAVYFPLDGTIFLAAKGYRRTEDSLPMSFGSPWNHTFDFYFSEYSFRSFFSVIANQTYDFKVTNFTAAVSTLDSKVDLSIHEKGVLVKQLRSKEWVVCDDNHLHLDTILTAFVRPWITKDADGFVLNLEITEGKVIQMKLDTSYPFLASLGDLFGTFVEGYFKAYPTRSMPMPDLDLFGHKWKDWNIQSQNNHLRIGVTI